MGRRLTVIKPLIQSSGAHLCLRAITGEFKFRILILLHVSLEQILCTLW